MTETSVVHVRDPGGFDVYIGRAAPRARDERCHVWSVFANPFSVRRYGLAASLEYFDVIWRHRLGGHVGEYWRDRLESLRGKRIACWCKEDGREVPCHGDVLVKLLEQMENTDAVHPIQTD